MPPFTVMVLPVAEFGGCLRPDGAFLGKDGEGDEFEEFIALMDVCNEGGGGRFTLWSG
jgi:hypothetical protein